MRYFTVYGPRQRPDMAIRRLCEAATGGPRFSLRGDGSQVRDFTHVSDAVDATVAALDAPPGVYNVGGGTRATVNALLDAVRGVIGSPVEARHGPATEGDMRSTWADSRRAMRSLGYRPRVGLEAGILAQTRWARKSLVAAPA
jgi:nucleoside-diphosphate-sugar epimerase